MRIRWTFVAQSSIVRRVHNFGLMTTREVAAAFGVTTREVARRVERGVLEPAVKLPGIRGAFLFDSASIEAETGRAS